MSKFCKSALLALFAGALFLTQAQTFIRGNLLGYFPGTEKRVVVMSSENIAGRSWNLIDERGNSAASGTIGASIEGRGANSPSSYNFEILFSEVNTAGNYRLTVEGLEDFAVRIGNNLYQGAIHSALRWLRVHRSGTNETLDRLPAHFGDSTAYVYYRRSLTRTDAWTEDENGKYLDLRGGWYVGANFTKSTPLIAFTSYYLLRAYNANPEIFERKYSQSNLVDILDEARFGLDYLMKVMPNDTDFIINVGGFDATRGVRLPHNDIMEGKRTAYSILSSSDMGLTAAALALGARTFRSIDAALAERYQNQAIRIFERATARGVRPEWLDNNGWTLFPNMSDQDDLLLAAAELFRLTGDEKYLRRAKSIGDNLAPAYWVGWETQNMPAQALIANQNPRSRVALRTDLEAFLNTSRQNRIWRLPMNYSAGMLYNMFIIGFSAANYTQIFDDKTFAPLVINSLNYTFGLNNWGVSFMALRDVPSVRYFNLPIYRLQMRLFPEGSTALGPLDRQTHFDQSRWILDDMRVNPMFPFNTPAVVFFDHMQDYMSTDSRIDGVASIIYLMTLANTIFGGN